MKNNMFAPLEWCKTGLKSLGNTELLTDEAYEEITKNVESTFIPCNTDWGKSVIDKINKVDESDKRRVFFTKNMVKLINENLDKVVVVRDTDLLIGYLAFNEVTASFKYFIDNRVLTAGMKRPRTAEEVFNFMLDNFGCVPVKFTTTNLMDLVSTGCSNQFRIIKNVMENGDNSDVWNATIKKDLENCLTNLEYAPNELKYYFILQGDKSWYLKVDVERNKIAKEKYDAKMKAIKEKAEAKAAKEAEAETTPDTAEEV